ncbi:MULTISPECIES: hypothetical protein [Parachlamydia]|uniref:Lipoprotein n=2 Tax=Parachlamydia acanthamoebae TaxID=83552 RepID=F8KXW0_PARAV|nr:hypothetical protein [Parachlamydia acanthamoebae]KIA78609.1 hypothetical protein DB43_DS00360 [Parachlamydia acanthamoebae]CCB85690.1 putative uncharacterized protein [Parachlamydia acanthamoebae UV-7]
MRGLLHHFISFLCLCSLSGCGIKSASPYEPMIESIESPPQRPNLLFAEEMEKGAYKLFVDQLDASQHYLLYVRGNVNRDTDCQEVLIHPDGTVSLTSMPEKRLVLSFEPTLLGESFDVFLLSMDKTLLGLAHLIPFPVINTQIEGYSIQGEILNQTAECLFFTASGFDPEEEVLMASGLNDEDGHLTKYTASKDGILRFIENPAYRGRRGGKRKLLMIGKKQRIEAEYLWGTKLLDYSHAFFQSRTKSDST